MQTLVQFVDSMEFTCRSIIHGFNQFKKKFLPPLGIFSFMTEEFSEYVMYIKE